MILKISNVTYELNAVGVYYRREIEGLYGVYIIDHQQTDSIFDERTDFFVAPAKTEEEASNMCSTLARGIGPFGESLKIEIKTKQYKVDKVEISKCG